MSKHSDAFEAWLEVQHYCEDRECDDCCFSLGKDHDSEGYCPFDTYFLCPKFITDGDVHEEISKRVYFLEQLELDKYELSLKNDEK